MSSSSGLSPCTAGTSPPPGSGSATARTPCAAAPRVAGDPPVRTIRRIPAAQDGSTQMNKRRRMTARELSRGLFLVAVTVGLLSACGGSADNGLPGRTASVQPPTVSLSFERTPSSETDAIPPVTSTISASSPDVTTRTPILGQSSDPSTAVSSAEHTESSTTQTQVASRRLNPRSSGPPRRPRSSQRRRPRPFRPPSRRRWSRRRSHPSRGRQIPPQPRSHR